MSIWKAMNGPTEVPDDDFGRSTDFYVGAGIWAAIFGALWMFAGISPPEAVWIWLRNGMWLMQPEQLGNIDAFNNSVGMVAVFAVWYMAIPCLPFWLGYAVMSDGRRVANNPKGYAVVFATFIAIGVGLAMYAASQGKL